LRQVKNTVEEINPKAEVILFGSRARGDAKENSDWDFLILTEEKVGFLQEDIYRKGLFELELELGEVLTLLFFSKNEWNGRQRITPLYYNVS
jgi:predicted nucleotidyltransferase